MDLLSDVLALLKLKGTLYFRTAFSSPWAIQVPSYESVARFHLVHRGHCWLSVAGVEKSLLLQQGDLAIVTRGAEHCLSNPPETLATSVDRVVADSGFTGEGALVYGGPGAGHDTQLICGHFAFDADAAHPLLAAMPAYIHVRNTGDASHLWLESSLNLIGSEAGRANLGGDLIALKLSEVIFAQAIRAYLSAEGGSKLVFRGFADPGINQALRALHREPSNDWTLAAMARTAGLSRTAFAKRFNELMGMTPMRYLTGWRMQIGRRLLRESELSILEIAERSGYRSEAAFGRVFKRHFSTGPAGYRRMKRPRPTPGE